MRFKQALQGKRCHERTMHDQPRIAFNLSHVVQVVMDAVGIERNCGITKQQGWVHTRRSVPITFRQGLPSNYGAVCRLVDNVLLLVDLKVAILTIFVSNGDK